MKKKLSGGFLIIIALFFAAGAMSWRLYFKAYVQADTADISSFPMEVGDWVAEDMPLTEREYAILETRNVFVRKYTNQKTDDILYLFVVYSQSNRKVSHPPEICYTGAGNILIDKELIKIPLTQDGTDPSGSVLMANKVLSEKGPRKEIFYYWFKVGDSFTPSYWKQQALIAWKSFLGEPASSAMVRVSGAVIDNDQKGTRTRIQAFIRQITPLLYQHLP